MPFNRTDYFVLSDDTEMLATLVARMLTVVQPEIDESEAYELINEFMKQEPSLTIESATLIGRMIRAETMFNPKRDVWQ